MEDRYNSKYKAEKIDELLERADTSVTYKPQTLTPEEQAQTRTNIGAVASVNGITPDEKGNVELEIGVNDLPSVTANDIGKFLRVNADGKWAASDFDTPDKNTNPDIHAEYFTITDDGIVSLKPEYRGGCPSNRVSAFPFAVSDRGANKGGSKMEELPKHLIIPEVVNETVVVSLAPGMFIRNMAIEEITIPHFITAIPDRFCDTCWYFRRLHGTENVETVGQVCFQQTRIEKAYFPKLTSLGMGAFHRCPFLVYIDVGNITRVENLTFTYASMLSRIKGGAGITFVGQQAFTKNYRLRNVEFLPKLKSIGYEAFHRCRLKYDWKSLADNGCAFPDEQKSNGDTLAYNGKNTPWHLQGKPDASGMWWENCTVTPCENPVPTLLSQTDDRWVDREINAGRTYKTGCSWMSIMHIYCALHNLTLSTVEEFENIVGADIKAMFVDGSLETAKAILEALGVTVTLAEVSQERLQTLYNSLNSGAYAITELYKDTVTADSMHHAAMIYGVNANKELLVADSNVPADENVEAGEHTIKYAMPIENMSVLTGSNPCRILIASL